MKVTRMSWCIAVLFAGLCSCATAGDMEGLDLANASLDDLLNMKVSVASMNKVSIKDSPGIVTVITRDEIAKMGARNMQDILLTVPGFDFGLDTQGGIGIGVRGNWANEGKALVLVDGQTYNENLYSTVQWDRFPVEQIEQIEIIRGPGSAIYGGNAELAVISITTRTAKSLNGSQAYTGYGQMTKGFGRRYGGYSYGTHGEDWELTGLAYLGEAQRSDRTYTDVNGDSYSMNGRSALNETNVNIGFKKKDLSVRVIADSFRTTERDQYDAIMQDAVQLNFPSYSAEVKYEAKLSDKLQLVPKVSYNYSKPWNELDTYYPFDKVTKHYGGNLTAFYNPAEATSIVAGGEIYTDSVKVYPITEAGSGYADGKDSASYDNRALFFQGTHATPFVNITAGGRYDNHTQFGSSFVPRVALTKSMDKLRLKAMYSQAFRAPSIENIRLNTNIRAERTTALEFESGYQLSKTMDISANIFQIYIKDPIVYNYDASTNMETYENFPHTGTRGAEISYQVKTEGLSVRANYTYYQAYENEVNSYKVADDSKSLMGLARHKVALVSTVDLVKDLSVTPTMIWLANRHAFDANSDPIKCSDVFLANLFVLKKNAFTDGLSLGAGVNNALNTSYSYIQPYDGGHTPLPSASREFVVKASYEF